MLLVHRNELQNKIVSNTFEKWYKQTTSFANITRLNNFVHQQTFVPYIHNYFDFVYQKKKLEYFNTCVCKHIVNERIFFLWDSNLKVP